MIVGFFGALAAGLVPVPAYPPDPARLQRSMPRLTAMLDDARPSVVLSTAMVEQLTRTLAADTPLARLPWVPTDAIAGLDTELGEPGEVAFVQYTSGSTGQPRGVRVPHTAALANLDLIYDGAGLGPDTITVGWTPLYHDMGLLMTMLGPMFLGGRAVVMSPLDFLSRPLSWLQTIDRVGAEASGGPNFAFELCVRKLRGAPLDVDLSRWRYAFLGAEPIRADTLDRFAAAFAPHGFRREALYPTYGLAENTLLVAAPPPGESAVIRSFDADGLQRGRAVPGDDTRLVSAGQVRGPQAVAIVDETGAALPDRHVGEIRVQGPSVARDYYGRPDETDRLLRSARPDAPGPWLRTGDLGFLDDGELFIVSREKDLIVVRGRNVHPQDVEAAVEQHAQVRPGCSAAFAVEVDGEERVAVAVEVRDAEGLDPEAMAAELFRRVVDAVDVSVETVVFLPKRALPKTSSGKLQRREVAWRHRDGELGALAVVTGRGLADAWLKGRFSAEDELDSLARIELAQEAERVLGRAIETEHALGGSVGDEAVARGPATRASAAQQAMWHDTRRHPGVHVNHVAFDVYGPLDVSRVHAAAEQLAAAFPSLRTRFEARDGAVVRTVTDGIRGTVRYESLRPGDFDRRIQALGEAGLDPAYEVCAISAFRIDPEHHIIVLSLHHVIYDAAWVIRLVQAWLDVLDTRPIVRLPTPFERFVTAQDGLSGEDVVRDIVSGHQGMFDPGNGVRTDGTAFHALPIADWPERARAHGVTPFEWLAGAFAGSLAHVTGRDDVLFQASVTLRDLPGCADVDGPAFNTMPLRLSGSGDPAQLARAAREAKARVWPVRGVPVPIDSSVGSGLGPVLLHLYDWRRYPDPVRRLRAGETLSLRTVGVRARPLAALTVPRPFDLSVGIGLEADRVTLGARYDASRLSADTVADLLQGIAGRAHA